MTTKTVATIKIDTKTLREALQKVHLIPKNKNSPRLSDVFIECKDGEAMLRSTDLEKFIQVEIPAESEPFTTVLPRSTVLQFLQGGDGATTIIQNGLTCTLEREQGTVKITSHKPEDFPPTPKFAEFQWHRIDAKWFLQMLGIAITACAKEPSRPILTGILLRTGAMVSVNGFRLVVVKSDKLRFGEYDAIVPYQAAEIARRLFSKAETLDIGIEIVANQFDNNKSACRIHLRSGNTLLVSQLIQGNFPNYLQLVSTTSAYKNIFSAPLMMQRLKMITPPGSGVTRFAFRDTEQGGECQITAKEEDEFEYALSLPVKIEGEDNHIAFNHKYVMDAIKPFSVCTLELNSTSQPGKFTGDIEELTVVIMPCLCNGRR